MCSIVVVFSPLTPGPFNSVVTVNYNNGLGSTLNVHRSLAGTGIP